MKTWKLSAENYITCEKNCLISSNLLYVSNLLIIPDAVGSLIQFAIDLCGLHLKYAAGILE
jgi:hypothetical protein